MFKMFKSLRDRASNAGYKAQAAVGTAIALSPFAAMAQGAPDLSAIEGELDGYKAAVVGLVIAFAVVLWAIRAAGLAKPR